MLAAEATCPLRGPRRGWSRRPGSRSSSKRSSSSAITSATASGVDFSGVSMRSRSAENSPVSRLTGAALIPMPPKSMPMGSAMRANLVRVAGCGEPVRAAGDLASERAPSRPAALRAVPGEPAPGQPAPHRAQARPAGTRRRGDRPRRPAGAAATTSSTTGCPRPSTRTAPATPPRSTTPPSSTRTASHELAVRVVPGEPGTNRPVGTTQQPHVPGGGGPRRRGAARDRRAVVATAAALEPLRGAGGAARRGPAARRHGRPRRRGSGGLDGARAGRAATSRGGYHLVAEHDLYPGPPAQRAGAALRREVRRPRPGRRHPRRVGACSSSTTGSGSGSRPGRTGSAPTSASPPRPRGVLCFTPRRG